MAYHAGRGAVCLVGGDRGTTDTTSERPCFWDGMSWTEEPGAAASSAPPVTSLVGLAADVDARSVLAYGGFLVLGPRRFGAPQGDLWELDAALTWHLRTATGDAPGPRHHHAMAFDEHRGYLLLYGGFDAADGWPTDTWMWDRRRWWRVSTSTGPGERAHHAMAYDTTHRCIVLRGGVRKDRTAPTDTWAWGGRTWERLAADGPGPGEGSRLAHDAARHVTVMFGGDTVTWDGTVWTRHVIEGDRPAARTVHALAYDPRRQRTVLYGGAARGGISLSDTWEWDGRRWRRAI